MRKIDRAARLTSLEALLRKGTALRDVFVRYEDLLFDDPDFTHACRPASSPVLGRLVADLTSESDGRREPVLWARPITRYSPAAFVHGMGIVAGRFVGLLYWEASDLGLACVAAGFDSAFVRFTKVEVATGLVSLRRVGHGVRSTEEQLRGVLNE